MYYTSSFHIIPMIFSTTKTKNKQTNKQKQITYSFHFSHRAMCNSLWPHETHHARPPCPSPTP